MDVDALIAQRDGELEHERACGIARFTWERVGEEERAHGGALVVRLGGLFFDAPPELAQL